jgi:hypothetical protein
MLELVHWLGRSPAVTPLLSPERRTAKGWTPSGIAADRSQYRLNVIGRTSDGCRVRRGWRFDLRDRLPSDERIER